MGEIKENGNTIPGTITFGHSNCNSSFWSSTFTTRPIDSIAWDLYTDPYINSTVNLTGQPIFDATVPKTGTTTISYAPVINKINYKYNERKIIEDFQKYIDSTYSQHYVGKNNVQALDIWVALGSFDTSCRDTAIKYLMRYGKKDGKNKKDLLKALHYIILMINDLEGDNGKKI
jgi:hypothetical protein